MLQLSVSVADADRARRTNAFAVRRLQYRRVQRHEFGVRMRERDR